MSINSVVNDTVTSESVINALKPLPPTISGYSVGGVDDTALDPAGGQTVQINGTGFLAGATITFDGNAVAVVTYVNPNRLTFTSPAKSAGTYTIYVVNPDGGTAIFIPGIIYSVLPTWTTSAGSLGSYYETTSISNTVIATGDAPITYSLFSGSLPTGSTLYANGVITGTAPVDSSSTTYSFTIQASDAQLQDSTRSFSLTINVDAVTWVSPANNTTYTSAVDSAIANVTLSATDAAGYAVSYSANALPTGLSLSGANISGTPTVIADSSTLLTATAATTNRTAVRTINWSITVANDPYFEYNTLLIPGASTTFVDDASTNNFAVSIFGDTKPNSFNPYTPGYYSNYFDGTGDYISVPDNVAFTMGAGDFTLECWVYLSSVAQQVFIGTCDAGGNQGSMSFTLGISNTGTPRVAVGYAGTMYYSSAASTISTGQWHHVAGVRNGAMVNIYVNGVKGPDLNMAALAITDSSEVVGIGRNGAYNGEYVTGYISNVRIVKGTAVYTTTFTPPTTPLTAISGTSLLTCQSNRFIDNSANAFTVTVGGNTTVNSFQPFVPNSSYSTYGSGYFDGTGDYLTAPNNAAFNFGTGNFTVECWVYVISFTGSTNVIISTYQDGSNGWTIGITSNVFYGAAAGDTAEVRSSVTPAVNTWTHLALTRSSTTLSLFVNGVVAATQSNSTNMSTTSAVTIGTNVGGGALNFTGYITDVRVVKGTAVYTTAFTPPSTPLTAIANTSLLTLQNNQSVNNSVFLDNSTNNFLVTRNGNTTQGTFSPYGGNWSNYFDGTGDYLNTPSNAAFGFGTGDFTIEFWAYSTSSARQDWIDITDGSNRILFYYSPEGAVSFYGNGGLRITGSAITLNTWIHYALSKSSGSTKMFVNGVQAGSTYATSQNYGTVSSVTIGKDAFGSTYITGYMSNICIVKGTALYTSNFTPSTTPLTPITNTSLLTCQSNRLIDNSLNNFTITKNGDVSVQRFSPFNPSSVTPTSYSGYFDGSEDYLTTPITASGPLDLGSGSWTVEAWVMYTGSSLTSGYRNFLTFCNNSGYPYLQFGTKTGTGYVFAEEGTQSTVPWSVAGTTLLTSNVWHHIATVRNGNNIYLYLDGVLQGSVAYSGTIQTFAKVQIGSVTYSGSVIQDWTGYISNARIVKGVAVYTGAFTVPTSPLAATQSSGTNIAAITGTSTSLLTLQSTTFIDNSTNNFTITAFGNTQPTIQNPFGFTSTTTEGYTVSTIGGSGYFDGTGDYLSTPSLISAPGDFTLECWFNTTIAVSDVRMLCGGNIDASASDYLLINASGVEAQFGSGAATVLTAAYTFVPNTWYHVAMTRSGTTVKVFVNGVSLTTSQGTQSETFSIRYIAIGYIGLTYTGYIADLRFVVGTSVYTSNFVLPAQPLTAIQNTSLLTNMTSAGIYDAAMMNNMESVADAKLSTAVSKFGGSSMFFDGTGDYLTSPSSPNNQFGTGNYTIEAWIYPTNWSSSGSNNILNIGTYITGLMIRGQSPSGIEIYTNNTQRLNLTTGITANTWQHIALVRNGSACAFYVNGSSIGTFTDSSSISPASAILTIGMAAHNASEFYTGYMDDFRITRGYARYTANFSAPTSAFQLF